MNVFALSILLAASFLLHIFLMAGVRKLPSIERRVFHPLMWAVWTGLIWLVAEGDPSQEQVTMLVGIAGIIGVAIGLWREVAMFWRWSFRFGRTPQPKALIRPFAPPLFSVYDAGGRAVTRGMGPRSRGIRVSRS